MNARLDTALLLLWPYLVRQQERQCGTPLEGRKFLNGWTASPFGSRRIAWDNDNTRTMDSAAGSMSSLSMDSILHLHPKHNRPAKKDVTSSRRGCIYSGIWISLHGRCRYRVSRTLPLWGVVAHWLSQCLSTEGSQARIALQPTRRDLGQVLHLELPVALRRVNSDTVSNDVVGIASERLML